MKKEKRLVLLALFFFLSGAAFFFTRAESVQWQAPPDEPASARPLSDLPEPVAYQSFTYGAQAEYRVLGTCTDDYYAILIFEEGVDYRESPLDAKYNVASPCTSGSFTATIALKDLPLQAGKHYYVVRAHQGSRGGWYNPY